MELDKVFDWVASVLIISSLTVGFWEASSEFGPISAIIEKAINQPMTFGLGLFTFWVGFDTWAPALPSSFLGPFSFLSWLYPFAEGFVPHFSIWTCLVALLSSVIVTWIFLHITEYEFWWHGLGVALLTFAISWYAWTLVAWHLMYVGGSMIGLTSKQVHDIWLASVTSVKSPILQWFFVITIPFSFGWLVRKVT